MTPCRPDKRPMASYALYRYEQRILLIFEGQLDMKKAQNCCNKKGLPTRNAYFN